MKTFLILSLFLSVFLTLLAVTAGRRQNQQVKVGVKKKPSLKDLLKQANHNLTLLLVKNKKHSRKESNLEQKLSVAGFPVKPEEFIAFQWLAAIICGGLLYLITSNVILSLFGTLIGFFLPSFWLKSKTKKRISKFNQGLPSMITTMIGSLRAGFSFPQSLQMVAEESYSPIKEEVELVLKKMRYGTTLEDALLEWKERMPSEDLALMVEAINIQRQVGGNLAYLMDKIAETIRERTKIENQIKTLTAQGRLSGIIISLLPVGLGIIIYLLNPAYMGTLFTNPIGQAMLGASAVGGIIGFILIRKITTIEV